MLSVLSVTVSSFLEENNVVAISFFNLFVVGTFSFLYLVNKERENKSKNGIRIKSKSEKKDRIN